MTITLKQLGPKRWYIDVAGTLPNGEPFRKRTRQNEISSETAARQWGERIWKSAVQGEIKGSTPTVADYATKWLAARTKKGLSSAKANKYQLAHLLPYIGDKQLAHLTRRDIADAIAAAQKHGKRSKGGGEIAPRTVLHSYRILGTMLGDAVADGLIESSPATLKAHRQELPTKKDKDPKWRRTAIYEAHEIRLLISDERLGEPARVAYALEGLAGLRYGEASALSWADWEQDKPLGRLDVHKAYDSNNARLKADKMDTQRAVPVHVELAAMLERWHATGWKAHYRRPPKPADLIIPVLDGKTLRHRRVADGRRPHVAALKMLGLRYRRQHDLRRTFITLCRDSGGSTDLLRWITHGVRTGSVMDSYTTPKWPTLCAFVENIKLL